MTMTTTTTTTMTTMTSKVITSQADGLKQQQQQQQQQPLPMKLMSPKTRAVMNMAMASSLHFAGFELARMGTIALFTSGRTGFSSPAAAPFCTACVSPVSIIVLWAYTISLERRGPRASLWYSAVAFGLLLATSAIMIHALEPYVVTDDDNDQQQQHHQVYRHLVRMVIFGLNVCENVMVQLLHTQHWSFLGSICPQVWFAPIAGLGSVASTCAALAVSPLVDRVGLTGLLFVSSWFLVLSAMFGDYAYQIAQLHDFEPHKEQQKQCPSSSKPNNPSKHSLVQTARKLFERVPILGSLCVEVLVSQCVSSLISFLFVLKVKEYIPNDQERARWTGTVYAWINASSGVLQFAVLPFLVKRTDARKLWLLMPSLMVACATLMSFQSTISLHLVAAVFSVYKALEYSVRGVTVEMVYTPLDYQSRFVGKEIIGLCVSRFGISGMAIGLSVVTTVLGSSPILDQVFVQALSVSSLLWLVASLPLANGKVKSRIRNNRKSTQKEERKEDDCC